MQLLPSIYKLDLLPVAASNTESESVCARFYYLGLLEEVVGYSRGAHRGGKSVHRVQGHTDRLRRSGGSGHYWRSCTFYCTVSHRTPSDSLHTGHKSTRYLDDSFKNKC